jgi:hypothetical protein
MIRIDLSLPRRKEKLTPSQFTLLFVGIFLGALVIVSIGLVLQWSSLNNLADEIEDLRVRRDSLQVLQSELVRYQELCSRRDEISLAMDEARSVTSMRLDILALLRAELQPGMRFLSARIKEDSVVAHVLSPSNVKVARYVEALSQSGFFGELMSEPQGTRQGLIEHRVSLRMR